MTAGLDIQASLSASISSLTAAMAREQAWREKITRGLTQIPFAGSVAISGGNGTYDQADQLQAKAGFIWSIRRLTVQGFSAGTVTAYRNSTSGEPILPFPVPAVNTIGKGELLLMPNDRLVWLAAGISGTVTFWGVADCFESWYLPFYIG